MHEKKSPKSLAIIQKHIRTRQHFTSIGLGKKCTKPAEPHFGGILATGTAAMVHGVLTLQPFLQAGVRLQLQPPQAHTSGPSSFAATHPAWRHSHGTHTRRQVWLFAGVCVWWESVALTHWWVKAQVKFGRCTLCRAVWEMKAAD